PVERGVRELAPDQLPPGLVTVRVAYSSVNYKDALATVASGRVARISPLVPGIDLAGEVVASDDPTLPPGTAVLAHGYDLGVGHHGGYAEYARVPAEWVVPLPRGLTPRQAMAIGTAGVDWVGGATLAYVLRTLRYGGAVAASGLTGGPTLQTTVLPFILRGVALLGVDSAQLAIQARRDLWGRLARDLRPPRLEDS